MQPISPYICQRLITTMKSTHSKAILTLLLFSLLTLSAFTQSCSPDSLVQRQVKARITDAAIAFEFQNHHVYYNPDCTPNDKLLLHLVGTFDNPASTTYFPSLAAHHGYKAISLKYPNLISGTSACTNSTDPDCHWKYHQEVLFGTDTSGTVTVDSTNSIVNRITKLLIYLHANYPSENWDAYLTASNTVKWESVVVSGHSQGGGHMAFLAKYRKVDRVIAFASPNEYSTHFSAPATWVSLPSATADSNYYAFGNRFDEVVDFSKQYAVWKGLNMHTPIDSFNVEGQRCPYNNARILFTDDTSSTGIARNHNSVVIDNWTPVTPGSGSLIFPWVWEYLLGLCDKYNSVHAIHAESEIVAYPNPSNGAVTLSSSEVIASVAVYNSVGQLIYEAAPRNTQYQLALSVKGLLLVHVEFVDGSRQVLRVINNE